MTTANYSALVSMMAAFLVAMLSIFLQLLLIGSLLINLPLYFLLAIFGLLVLFGLVFAMFCRMICRLIEDKSINRPKWLMPMATQLAQRFEMLPPELHTMNATGLNAFALQGLFDKGHVLINDSLFKHLHQDEVEAVLAHEYSHIASRHSLMLTLVQGMTLPLTLPIAFLAGVFYAFLFGLEKFRSTFLTLHHMMTVLLFPVTSIVIAFFTRGWEFAADRHAAQVIGNDKYITALKCLHGSFFQHPNLLNITADANGHSSKYSWALSHPSLAQRINALLEIGPHEDFH